MKRMKLLALCLAAAMLAACSGNQAVSGSASAPGESASSAQPSASFRAEEKQDFYDLVFDTQQDAGRLTVRYLSLQSMYGSGNTAVTTGDSAVYTSPDGLVMLVDCGNVLGGEEVTEQLKAMGVEKIDIFVLSHPHADHVGGFCTVADNFAIGQVYTNGHEYDSGTYRSMVDRIDALEIPWETLSAGDTFSFGEEVQVQIYSPFEGDMDEVAGGYLDANDGSIAMRLTYGQSSFWTSGDLYIPGEQLLAQTYGDEIQSGVAR